MKALSANVRPAILLAVLCSLTAKSEPVLTNGSFQEPSPTGLPMGWRVPKDFPVAVERDPSYPGGAALRVDITTVSARQGEISQTLRGLSPDAHYTLRGRLRGTRNGAGFLQVKRFLKGKEIERTSSLGCTADWNANEVRFSTVGADRIDVLCRTNPSERNVGGSVWFAGIEVIHRETVPLRLKAVSAVPTLHAVGLQVDTEGDWTPGAAARARYRPAGAIAWIESLPLVARPTEAQFRGSLLELAPETEYEVEVTFADRGERLSLRTRTWPVRPPVGQTLLWEDAQALDAPRLLDRQGTPEAWVHVRPAPGSTGLLQAGPGVPHALLVKDAAYVIVEGFTIRGGDDDAVRIQNAHDILVVGCDIAGWGEVGSPNAAGVATNATGKAINMQSGISVHAGAERIRIERNFIHAPRGSANSWQYGHPHGPTGISLSNPLGNILVLDNDLIGSEDHWWNDGIEGEYNSYVTGGPHRDTDYEGNTIAFANDDGMELDGGQINVRSTRNLIRWTYCGVSCAPNLRGPSYVTRNVIVLGDARGKANFGFKMGGAKFRDQGLSMLLHNTVVSHGEGLSAGHYGEGPSPILSRNNVFHLGGILYKSNALATFARDLVPPSGLFLGAPELDAGCLTGIPRFVDEPGGDFRLAEDSPGTGAAVGLDGQPSGNSLGALDARAPGTFPARGGRVRVTPGVVAVPPEAKAAEVSLTFDPQAGTTWQAIPNSAWLRAEPASGPCDGTPQPLRVLVDPTATVPGRRHRGALTLRTNEGHLRTLFVTYTAPAANPFAWRMEAEDAPQQGFEAGTSAAASGGRYLVTPVETPHQQAFVDFEVEIPSDGDYEVWARCLCEGPATSLHDSFFFSLDGSEPAVWNLGWRAPSAWAWQQVAPPGGPHPRFFRLEKGPHRFRFLSREPRARLDAIHVGNHPPEDGYVVEPVPREQSTMAPHEP